MLKTLTLSLSLAVALGFCSVSKAQGLFHKADGCATCGIASPQGPVVSPQGPAPSPQGECGPVCSGECGARKKCHLFENLHGMGNKMSCSFTDLCAKLKPKPKCYTYEWVLKKKRVWGHHGGGCGTPGCETCGIASPQGGYSSPQAGYTSPQASYGSGQVATTAPMGGMMAAPAPIGGDEAPPAPEVSPAAPPVPAPPAPPAPGATSSLLFSTPSGN
jgi:hypothetical protein